MLINATMLVKDPTIIQGLLDGSLVRFGSVIREAGTGQIVRHLLETPGLTQQIMAMPFNPVLGSANAVSNIVGHSITATKLSAVQNSLSLIQGGLSSVLQLSQIAAGASVLNLGVSVAGFAYMAYKLNQLQTSINTIQTSIETGFDNVNQRLDAIAGHLAYLNLLVKSSLQEQQKLGQAISDLHRTLLIKEMAELQAEFLTLSRYPDESPRPAMKVAARVRLFMADQALQTKPANSVEAMVIADTAVQTWAAATAAEVYLLLNDGLFTDAQAVLQSTLPQFKDYTQQWSAALLQEDCSQLTTAYRFATPRFKEHITQERISRIASNSPVDRHLSDDQRWQKMNYAQVELEMFRNQGLGKPWLYRQIALAEYLDTMSELSARLEGLQHFTDLCSRHSIRGYRDLQIDDSDQPNLYAIAEG